MSKGRRGYKQPNKRYKPSNQGIYWQQQGYSNQLFLMFQNDLMELALSRFHWVNLPSTCNARYLEWLLLTEGCATLVFAQAEGGDKTLLSLKAVQQGMPNMYGEPRAWRCIGQTGRTIFPASWSKGVWIWDNATRYPLMVKINMWAKELADIMQTRQINRFHMRMPFVITAPQDRVMDVQNLYRNITNGEPFVLGYDTFSDIEVKATFPQRAHEYIGDKLQEEWENTWNAIYRELGINSMPFKEERMIEDEVTNTMQPTELARLSPLQCRREACDKLNERFGNLLDAPLEVVWSRDNITDNYDIVNRYDNLLERGGEDGGIQLPAGRDV